jgi:hypothetical protein
MVEKCKKSRLPKLALISARTPSMWSVSTCGGAIELVGMEACVGAHHLSLETYYQRRVRDLDSSAKMMRMAPSAHPT